MKRHNTLEELLASAFMAGAYAESEVNQPNFEQWLKLNEANILALEKPESLAKNKQFDNVCEYCNGWEVDELGDECNYCNGTGTM